MQENPPLKRTVFSETAFSKIALILSELLKRSQARLVVFADMNGYPIVHRGDIKAQSLSTLTALAAGSFAASGEIARLINNESRFRFIYQEGGVYHTYTCSVGEDYFLIVLFEKQVALGLIRLLTHQALLRISSYIKELQQTSEQAKSFLDYEFRDMLSRQLDDKLRVRSGS
ncbi:MAG: Roadblock/LC7 domain protein [bacterium ADurb.Bin478]|nr:MAG: Roadblock/LC7 domain protein [bacterium ADurb.Bin478]